MKLRFRFVVPWASGLLTLLLVFGAAWPALAQVPPGPSGPPAGPQTDVASYQLTATLDPDAKQVRGSERITYRNPSGDTLNDIWLYLYLNAFRSPDTQWMRESSGSHRGFEPGAPGWIKVERLALADGTPLALPGGGDSEDTIVRVALPRPLGPGQTLELEAQWTAQLPRVFARTGFADDFFMVGQWYPKLSVYDRGAWETEPWHANSEFFADYGNYDLAVTVPANYVTGACGTRQGETANADGSKTVRYRAERVTDVAWTAWPDFKVFTRDVQAAGRTTQLELLLPPEDAGQAERHLAAAQAALDAYGGWYGAYPWPKLTLVVPPPQAGGASGMEYPSLVTTGTNAGMPAAFGIDSGVRALETVTVHEIAHEWFPFQVSSNEGREAWLDEGFADYMTARLLARLYGADRSFVNLPGVNVGYQTQMRGQLALGGVAREPLATPSWQFESFSTYGATVYAKGTLALASLEGLYGEERFNTALRHYADTWRWRHPTSADLRVSLEESLGESLGWFFDSFVFGRDVAEYRAAEVTPQQATVERVGEATFPVDVRLTFADGGERSQRWDAQAERLTLNGEGRQIVALAVDPEQRLALEPDRLDNALTPDPSPEPALALADRWLALAQLLLQLLGQVG